jgi:hypothetical protein
VSQGGAIGKATGVGEVQNPGPWVTYTAGQSVGCPALTGPEGAMCGRRLQDVAVRPGIVFSIRTRSYQGLAKPTKAPFNTQACPKCGTVLEYKEEKT